MLTSCFYNLSVSNLMWLMFNNKPTTLLIVKVSLRNSSNIKLERNSKTIQQNNRQIEISVNEEATFMSNINTFLISLRSFYKKLV